MLTNSETFDGFSEFFFFFFKLGLVGSSYRHSFLPCLRWQSTKKNVAWCCLDVGLTFEPSIFHWTRFLAYGFLHAFDSCCLWGWALVWTQHPLLGLGFEPKVFLLVWQLFFWLLGLVLRPIFTLLSPRFFSSSIGNFFLVCCWSLFWAQHSCCWAFPWA
jgi:hypothetical protein